MRHHLRAGGIVQIREWPVGSHVRTHLELEGFFKLRSQSIIVDGSHRVLRKMLCTTEPSGRKVFAVFGLQSAIQTTTRSQELHNALSYNMKNR